MASIINQETFNAAVLENIETLELSPEDAVREAITQFESQGADLNSIIKEPPTYFDNIEVEIKELKKSNRPKADPKTVIEQLQAIKTESDKGLQYKILLAESGAYSVLLDTLSYYEIHDDVRKICLKTITSLMHNQPDLLDDRGVELILIHLKKGLDLEIRRLTLKWAKTCCIMHELNRQKLFRAQILEELKQLLSEDSSETLKETLAVCRALTLDDDVRIEYGKSQEYTRLIASDTLCYIVALLSRFRLDAELVNDLMITSCLLLIRAEYCRKVVAGGILETIKDIMLLFPSDEKVNRQSFKLLRTLAGDDECKIQIVQKKFAPVINAALDSNKQNIPTVTAGLYCVAALSLRSPENSKELFESGLPEVIIDLMKMYPDEKIIQKTASWAIRNMVCRNEDQSKRFHDLGIEKLLLNSLKKFKDIEYDINAALRDLGCNVQVKNERAGSLSVDKHLRYEDL